jgi:hypothetical protein
VIVFNEIYYIVIWALAILFVIKIMQDPSRIYHYPYIISFAFVFFIVPQVVVIYLKQTLPLQTTNRLFLMTILCWIMSFLGWYSYKPKSLVFKKFIGVNYNKKNLSFTAILFIAIGIIVNIIAHKLLKENDYGGQATGSVTILIFFQQLLVLGTGICLSLWLKDKGKLDLIFAIIGILYGFYIGILLGRRISTVTTLIVLGLPFFVHYKRKPPRIIIISFITLVLFIMPSIGQYRQILKTSNSTSLFFHRLVTELDIGKNFNDFYMNAESYELVNGAYIMDYTYRSSDYELGFGYWNRLIFNFVPGQIVGVEEKKSLMIDLKLLSENRRDVRSTNPNYITGGTATGMADGFQQFDYFGSLFFLFVAMFMKKLWVTINDTGHHLLQVFYAILLVSSILSITHTTTGFFPPLIFAYIFLYLTHLFAKT